MRAFVSHAATMEFLHSKTKRIAKQTSRKLDTASADLLQAHLRMEASEWTVRCARLDLL
jgi:hypothetical protein